MALGGVGYWGSNYWSRQWWHEDYWYAGVVLGTRPVVLLKITVDVEVDGERVRGFPLVRQVRFPSVQELQVVADAPAFADVPFLEFPTLQTLYLGAEDGPLSFRVEGAGSGQIGIGEGGLVLLIDTQVAQENLTMQAVDSVMIRGVGAGIPTEPTPPAGELHVRYYFRETDDTLGLS